MSATGLCIDFITSGRLLGADLDSSPDAWDRALGGPDWPLIDVQGRRMRRDYGLVEVSFEKWDADWTCTDASVHTHRLRGDQSLLVPPKIDATYGPIEPVVAFAEVLEGTLAKGALAELIADRDTELHSRYWFPGSEVIVSVQGPGLDLPGSIWSAGRARDAVNWTSPVT
jgi:hypothetical protein